MNIVIADDHALFRNGIRQLVAHEFPDADFTEAGSLDDVLIRDAVSERCFSRQYKMRSPLGWPFDRLRARG